MKRALTIFAVIAAVTIVSLSQTRNAATGNLKIYWIDAEGGAATLFVSPTGESMVFDTGFPGNGDRDAKRIYAAAQKNFGCAGTTMVVVNKNILGTVKRKIPKMLDYRAHIEKGSMHNTPAVFSVYVSYLTLQWIKKQGLKTLEEKNIRKAKKIYDAIDASSLFEGMVEKEDRSLMNVCFRIKEVVGEDTNHGNTLEEKFLAFAAERGIVGIKGYRTVGGFRASIYNAMPERGVDVLAEAIKEFENSL